MNMFRSTLFIITKEPQYLKACGFTISKYEFHIPNQDNENWVFLSGMTMTGTAFHNEALYIVTEYIELNNDAGPWLQVELATHSVLRPKLFTVLWLSVEPTLLLVVEVHLPTLAQGFSGPNPEGPPSVLLVPDTQVSSSMQFPSDRI